MRLCVENVIKVGGTTLNASSTAANSAIENILDDWRIRRWESVANTLDQWYSVTPLVSSEINMACLADPVLHAGGILYLEGLTLPSTWTTLAMYAVPTFNPTGVIVARFPTPVTYDTYRWFFWNQMIVSQAVGFGAAFLGVSDDFASIAQDFEIEDFENAGPARAPEGQETNAQYGQWLTHRGTTVAMVYEHRRRWHEIRRTVRRGSIFMIMDDTDPEQWVYARLPMVQAARLVDSTYWTYAFEFQESR